ncbi:MAG: sec-independent protein translocase protein TatA [Candidatus Paceibacteria bacterium]|jgi:sec-independent protein translocase protein TatA
MFGLGPRELIAVVVVFFLLFGAKKIPELARGMADSIEHLKNGFSDGEDKKISSSDEEDDDEIKKVDKKTDKNN